MPYNMEYNLDAINREINGIEERTNRLKELAKGINAVERNADAILAFIYLLKRNISDILE